MTDEEVTCSDLRGRVHHLKIMLRAMSGCDARDVWPLRNRFLDMRRTGMVGWPEKLKFQVEVNPRTKPHVTEMVKLLRRCKKMNLNEYIKVEWGPPCSTAKIERNVDTVATYRTSTGWKLRRSCEDWYQEYQSLLRG